jgi:hypothetical protein
MSLLHRLPSLRKVAAPALVCLVIVCAIADVLASNGVLRGQVLDRSNRRPIEGVNVVVEDFQIGAATDLNGQFRVLAVPVGTHNIRFSCVGYRTLVKPDVFVASGDRTSISVYLEPAPIKMEEVVVAPSYFRTGADASASFHNMDYAEIRIDPGSAEDVQRVVQVLPSVVTGSDQLNEIIVRGGMPNENLFIMDHIEIPNPNHFGQQGEGGGPINMLNNEFVREVDFYAGAFPARFGDKASSVMNIHLRQGNNQRYEGNVNMGMAGTGVFLEGPIVKDKSSFMFSARRSFLDLIIVNIGLTAVPRYHNLQGKIDIDLSPRHHLSFDGVYGHDYVSIEPEDEDAGYARGADRVISRGDQLVLGGTLRSLWGAQGLSHLTVSQVASRWDQDVWDADGTDRYANQSIESETTAKLDLSWKPNSKHEVGAGVDAKYVHFDIDRWANSDTIFYWDTNFKHAEDDTVIGIFRIYSPWLGQGNVNSYKVGAFLQYTLEPFPRTTLRAGCRWDRFDYTGVESLSPRLSLSYRIALLTTLTLALGEHTQSPSYHELTLNPYNRDLDNKVSRHIVFGIEHLFRPDTKATLELYYKDYRRVPVSLVATTPDPFDPSRGRLVNVGEGDSRGVEFFLQKKFSQNYHATLSLAYFKAQAVDPRYGFEYDWDYDHRYMVTVIGGYRVRFGKKPWYRQLRTKWWYRATAWLLPLADEMEIGIRWRYLGGRPYTEPRYHRNLHVWTVDEDQLWNTERFPPYHRLDLRIDRRFFFDRWNLITYFDIINLYQRDNIWDYSRDEYGEVEEILQWKVLPVGGLVIEF